MHDFPQFVGLDTPYSTAGGQRLARLHLDGAASPLAAETAVDAITRLLPHYSNSHSYVHTSAQVSTHAQRWAHDTILRVFNASPNTYTAIFNGSGTTACINRVARGLADSRPERKVVLVSAMEHHANDLPHRQFGNQVQYIPLAGEGAVQGSVDLNAFGELCAEHAAELNYVAVSSVSNVTGIKNPIAEMQQICRQYGALLLVDGAQAVAHEPSDIDALDVDFLVFSGHKVYTPMSPGVLLAKRSLLQETRGQDLGGGSVADVSHYDFQLSELYPDREQSGTPNIIGAYALAAVLEQLQDIGFERIRAHDQGLMSKLQTGLAEFEKIKVYGDPALLRTGALAFNHADLDHGLLAAILNDYYAIAVRNECFCAHPYVSSLLKEELWELDLSQVAESEQEHYINRKRGMVRASVSLYNSEADVDRLLAALCEIEEKHGRYRQHYRANPDGSYTHASFSVDWKAQLKMQ